MWLIMIAIGIGVGIAMVLAFFILIPAYAILAIPGGIVAAIPGAIGFGITSLFAAEVLPWISRHWWRCLSSSSWCSLPLFLLSGAYAVFDSAVWTLFYRQKNLPLVPPEVSSGGRGGMASTVRWIKIYTWVFEDQHVESVLYQALSTLF